MSLTKVTYSMIKGEVFNVLDYGDNTTPGTTDMTAAFTAAIAAANASVNASGGGTVYVPTGIYLITSTLTVPNSFIHILGDGSYSSTLKFEPTSNGLACLEVISGSSVVYSGSIQGIGFTSANSSFAKVALRVWDISTYLIDDIVIRGTVEVPGIGNFWSGGVGGSTGMVFRGREATSISNVKISADEPIVIGTNPNFPAIDIDHFKFENLYLVANGHPAVVILSDVNLTQVEFCGYFVVAHATYGLYWVDTETTGISQGLIIRGLRQEQSTISDGWNVYIDHNYGLQGLEIDSCKLDNACKGIFLRTCSDVYVSNVNYDSASKEAFNVDNTVSGITFNNCFWQEGSTVSIPGQSLVEAMPRIINNAPLPRTACYLPVTTTPYNELHNTAIAGEAFSLASGGIQNLGVSGAGGIIVITSSLGVQAIFSLNGTNNSTSEIADPAGFYSNSAATATSINIYWSAGNARYELLNNRPETILFKITHLGTGATFAAGG